MDPAAVLDLLESRVVTEFTAGQSNRFLQFITSWKTWSVGELEPLTVGIDPGPHETKPQTNCQSDQR